MKERPILFSGAMVRALLAGTKTQTRRACKPAPVADARFAGGHYFPGKHKGAADISVEAPYVGLASPYGQAGDRIWVRETFWAYGRWQTRFSERKRRDEWHFVDMTLETGRAYRYQTPDDWQKQRRSTVTPGWWKRPAIHMPRVASRILLEIVSVRVERLQAISEADAIAEGCELNHNGYFLGGPHAVSGRKQMATAQQAFRDLWESINGPESWEANPFVWCVEFKRVEAAHG